MYQMTPRWEYKYIGSSGTILHKPLKSGQCEFFKDEVFIVTDFEDYKRLSESDRGLFQEVSNNLDEVQKEYEANNVVVVVEEIKSKITQPIKSSINEESN